MTWNSSTAQFCLSWYADMRELCVSVDENKDEIVLISNKAPRIFEWFVKDDNSIINKDSFLEKITSEFSLPFTLPRLPKDSKIVIADDAIYNGTTFTKVLAISNAGRAMFGIEHPAMKSAMLASLYPLIEFFGAKNEKNIAPTPNLLPEAEISNYVDVLMSNCRSLGKPYNVDFPILYSEIELSDERIKDLKGLFKGRATAYETEHEGDTNQHSVSLCFNLEDRENLVSPSIKKIRFFFSDVEQSGGSKVSRVAVVPYTPHYIPDEILSRDCPLFEDTPFSEIWEKAFDATKIEEVLQRGKYRVEYDYFLVKNDNDEQENERLWTEQFKEYYVQLRRSLAALANYLLSFHSFCVNKGKITEALGQGAKFELKKSDLVFLLGKELADKAYDNLREICENWDSKKFELPTVRMKSSFTPKSVIPKEYKDNFTSSCRRDFSRSFSFSESVSSEFRNMRIEVEIPSRRNTIRLNRLRFGDDYNSLLSRLWLVVKEDVEKQEIANRLHKGLDYRIDNGSVTAKYVPVATDDSIVWARLYRAGENEDKIIDQLHRILARLLRIVSQKDTVIDAETLNNIFIKVFVESKKKYGSLKYKTGETANGDKRACVVDENGRYLSLGGICSRFGYIKSEEGSRYRIMINEPEFRELNEFDVMSYQTRAEFDSDVNEAII